MIDLHCHILPGIDDGPQTVEEAVAIARALTGSFGRPPKTLANRLLRDGLAHNVASDAHSIGRRPPRIAGELEAAGYGAQTEWLTEAVPRAILTGGEIPPPPPAPPAAGRATGWLGRVLGRGH